MGKFILGFITALVLLAAGAFAYIRFGLAPVATASTLLPFERQIARAALHERVSREAPKSAPIEPSERVYILGAGVYRTNCAVCHGMPGQDQTAIAKGEFPQPPKLLEGQGVTDDPVGVTYWKVANGIRLTGMPGFKGLLSEEQMWQVSLLLANADKLSPTIQTALRNPVPGKP
jgi:mono/diheme cytochrome c family protein